MAKFNFSKREWNRVWNNVKYNVRRYFWTVIEFCWNYIIRYAALAIGCVFMACIVLPVCLILVFNPVSFLLWALLIPASATSWLVSNDEDTVIDNVAGFCIALVKWEMYLLPWYAKKHFIAKFPDNFKSSTVMKYFRGLKNEKEQMGFLLNIFPAKGAMSVEYTQLMKEMWDIANKDERKLILTAKSYRNKAFSIEEVKYACESNMRKLVRENFEFCTPSSEVLKSLIGMYAETDDIDCEDWLRMLIKREGLSSELISWVYTQGSDKLKNLVENALRIHGQKDITKRLVGFYRGTDAAEWKAFCEETPNICAEAQMKMDSRMIKIFYEAGHHMDEEAIFYFLSNKSYIEEIYANEPDNGLISPRIKALVSGSETLSRTRIYIQQRKA